ncbi:MAG: type II toxin-antitoxin system RelE/ParE family toxin [Acetobacteraceae bacterium]|nr:type II toxin-antitoxin system RelE/ParE family toxin [Acetobacteraceae bacterium]
MTARPFYTPAARDDLRAIAGFIGQHSEDRAAAFVHDLREHCRRVAARPRLHRMREEFGPGVRAAVHGRYLIFYTERPDGRVVIERILHAARDLPRLLGR